MFPPKPRPFLPYPNIYFKLNHNLSKVLFAIYKTHFFRNHFPSVLDFFFLSLLRHDDKQTNLAENQYLRDKVLDYEICLAAVVQHSGLSSEIGNGHFISKDFLFRKFFSELVLLAIKT